MKPNIFDRKKQKNILFVASEAAPFARVGGLGSVMYSLPRALRDIGHDARIFIPRYLCVDPELYQLTNKVKGLRVPTNHKSSEKDIICNIKKFDGDKKDGPVTAYFLENQEYYEQRANVYEYSDDHIRFALLSRGALEFIRQQNEWTPDIIVASDWMTGLLPNYLKTVYKNDPKLSGIATVFSIHNLAFQGMFDHRFVQEMDYDDGHSAIPEFSDERLKKLNSMRRGIMYADMINTVSPTYAKEIMTEEMGEGLHNLLLERRAVVSGILNGIDHDKWDPTNDPAVAHPFSAKKLGARAKNKSALQSHFGLPEKKDAFLMGVVSRLDHQKGLDMLTSITETLLHELPIQLVVVGEGDRGIMSYFKELEEKFPQQVATHLKFDNILPHKVFAGADVVLVPSKFEPCGLIQMEAMRYGAIPVVRKTGGLADSVDNFNPEKNTGTGFVFERPDPHSLLVTTIRAYETFRHKKVWQKLQERAMNKDLSWERSAEQYDKLFTKALQLYSHKQKPTIKHDEMG